MNREEARLWIRGKADKAEEAIKRYGNLPADADIIPTIEREIEACRLAEAALRGWVKTADRLPEGDERDEILGLYKGPDYLLYDIVQLGWLRLHPEMYPYWTNLPQKPEVDA